MKVLVCDILDSLEVSSDIEKNKIKINTIREIQRESDNVKTLVIRTNEELEIAKQSDQLRS